MIGARHGTRDRDKKRARDDDRDDGVNRERSQEAGQEQTNDPQEPERVREYPGTGIIASLVAGLLLAIAAIIFIAQNGERVAMEWLWFDFRLSLAVVALAGILLGVAADELIGVFVRRRRRQRLEEREELERLRTREAERTNA